MPLPRRGAQARGRARAQKLAGMTGTAATEAQEFSTIYKLEVSLVPTNLSTQRADNPDVVFGKEAGAVLALAAPLGVPYGLTYAPQHCAENESR